MDLKQQSSVLEQRSEPLAQHPKQPWRKPTVSFIPLHVTAFEVGSNIDGNDGSLPPPP